VLSVKLVRIRELLTNHIKHNIIPIHIFGFVQGNKIHCTVPKDLVNQYTHTNTVGDWIFIEMFKLNYATGQFRVLLMELS